MGRGFGRGRMATAGLAMALISGFLVVAGGTPAYASVSAVSGTAFGYYANVGLFGGPQEVRGYGQTVDPPDDEVSSSPSVELPSGGGDVSDTDPDGAIGAYGPANIFESHGSMDVHTVGATGATGSATSTASVDDIQPNDPFQAPAPGGVDSTCTATESSLSGSTTITNGRLVLSNPDPDVEGEPGEVIVVPPVNPVPGTEYSGEIAEVHDFYRIVFNEQIRTPDTLTVNGAHMYLLGPVAIGDMVIAQSKCGVTASSFNQAPLAGNDAYTAVAGQALTVPANGLLANDSDPDSDPLSVTKTLPIAPPTSGGGAWVFPSDPANGTLTLNANGSFTYTPNPGFTGIDTFSYTAGDPRGKSATATATITVNAAPGTLLAVDNATVTEGNAGGTAANFTITRSGNVSGASSVKYKTSGGTATAGTDYTAVALTLVSFAAGETTKPVAVTVTGDELAEAHETFNLTLSAPTGATMSDTSGAGTIRNDDGQAYLSVNDVVVTEGNAGTVDAAFTIARSGNTLGTSTVSYKTTNGTATAGTDYTAIALTPVTFAPGETTKPVSVSVTGDAVDEVNETFTVNLSVPVAAVIVDTAGTGTIVDDDGPITAGPTTFYSVGDISVVEGGAGNVAATFTVTRSGNTAGTGSVKYKTTNGTAIGGSDFTSSPNVVLPFAAAETSKPVTIQVTGDTVTEADETFKLTLSAPVNGVLSDTSGTATILNDEFAYVSVNDVWVTEGNSGTSVVTFTITRSGNISGPASVSYKTNTGTATAPDFTAIPLTVLNFATGEVSKTVAVNVTGETTVEPNEAFTLALSAPVGVVVADAAGTATILNDD